MNACECTVHSLTFYKIVSFCISAVNNTVNRLAAFALDFLFVAVIKNVSECSHLISITLLGMTTSTVGFKMTFLANNYKNFTHQ